MLLFTMIVSSAQAEVALINELTPLRLFIVSGGRVSVEEGKVMVSKGHHQVEFDPVSQEDRSQSLH